MPRPRPPVDSMTSPRTFDSNGAWYAVTREWPDRDPAGDDASIAPDRVEAAEAPLEWVVTYEVASEPLRPGAHVALEVPINFRLDHGRPYPVGRGHIEHIDEARVGYAIPVDVRLENTQAELAFEVSNTSRFSVVDLVMTQGQIDPGDTVRIVIGEESGSRMRAPEFAQEFPMACGVDRAGDGQYRPVRPFPTVTVTGAGAAGFRVIAPSTVDPGSEFSIDVYPDDRYSHNPATGYDREPALTAARDRIEGPTSLDFERETPGMSRRHNETIPGDVYRVQNLTAPDAGVDHVSLTDADRGIAGRSNPVATDWTDRDLYWGEIHFQGYDSIGTGSTTEMFEWARDVEGLDFCGMASHYGGRYPATPDHWSTFVEDTSSFHDPGEFVTLVSYEWGGAEGDKNVYYRGDTGDFYTAKGNEGSIRHVDGKWIAEDRRYDTAEELWHVLDEHESEAITVPHHPKTAGFGLVDWDAFHNEYQRLVEIYSAWGDSEVGGPLSVRAGLNRGHRLGFTGGTDTHEGQPGHGTHEFNQGAGITGVYADELTRDGIFEALYERRTYASTGPRVLLDFGINGLTMGEERVAITADEQSRTATVRVVGTTDIDRIDLVCNGEVVAGTSPRGERASFEWTDDRALVDRFQATENPDGKRFVYYYPRVRQTDRHTVWGSPIWFLEA